MGESEPSEPANELRPRGQISYGPWNRHSSPTDRSLRRASRRPRTHRLSIQIDHVLYCVALAIHAHIYINMHVDTRIHTYIYTYIYTHTYTHTYAHTYAHTYSHTYMYTHTYTHT